MNDFERKNQRCIRDDKDFFDVTLACDDDQIQAHKVIPSACNPLFQKCPVPKPSPAPPPGGYEVHRPPVSPELYVSCGS